MKKQASRIHNPDEKQSTASQIPGHNFFSFSTLLFSCSSVLLLFCCAALGSPVQSDREPVIVTLSSPSPLIQVAVMVKAGSVHDPPGKEGLAYLTAQTLLEGGFGHPGDPVTKEELALMTRAWGEGAKPWVRVAKEVTTFYTAIPEDVLDQHLNTVFRPLFTRPLFDESELDRVRKENLERIRGSLRYEDIESLGLQATDAYIFEDRRYAHLARGSIQGLEAVSRTDLLSYYVSYYRPENLIIGLSKDTPEIKDKIAQALSQIGQGIEAARLPPVSLQETSHFSGRRALIVTQPNAASTGIHAAFPISVTRGDPDFWPLYVANVFFGTHRDGFSHLFREIRQKRGYNYGDYSYIEHWEGKPFRLFPSSNTPRQHQYFSIWIRPVGHKYAHHLMKALTWELENFVRRGLSDEQVQLAKNKAKILYLNLAETVPRLLNVRVDDAYYGMLDEGYLERYLQHIDGVTTEQVKSAIRKHLQAENIKYVLVTDDEVAGELKDSLAADQSAEGKTLEEYQIASSEQEGAKVYSIPPDKLEIIKKDAVWAAYPLKIPGNQIRVVPVEQMFEK